MLQLLFPWLRPGRGRPHTFFYFLKAEYHLELINKCMGLLEGGKMTVAVVQKCLKRGFYTWLPSPHLVVWYDMYKNHILYIYFLYLLLFSYNASAYKDHNQNWCVIGYVKVQNCLFKDFFAILGQILLCCLPWQ